MLDIKEYDFANPKAGDKVLVNQAAFDLKISEEQTSKGMLYLSRIVGRYGYEWGDRYAGLPIHAYVRKPTGEVVWTQEELINAVSNGEYKVDPIPDYVR